MVMNSKGFTFVELLVVFIVMSVLTIIAVPCFFKYLDVGRVGAVKHDLGEAYKVSQLCYHDGDSDVNWNDLENNGMVLSKGVVIQIENGLEKTLLVKGWHIDNKDEEYQVDHTGTITRR